MLCSTCNITNICIINKMIDKTKVNINIDSCEHYSNKSNNISHSNNISNKINEESINKTRINRYDKNFRDLSNKFRNVNNEKEESKEKVKCPTCGEMDNELIKCSDCGIEICSECSVLELSSKKKICQTCYLEL